jgi:hypothetical protein
MSGRQPDGMSIVARPSDTDPSRGSRSDDEWTIDRSSRAGVLLTSERTGVAAPARDSERALAPDALRVLRHVVRTAADDQPWSDPAFERAVETVRRHLAPIRSRRALARSFEREAFHVRRTALLDDGFIDVPGPVRLAYAIRWLELGDGQPRPSWGTFRRTHGRGHSRVVDPRHRPPATRRQHR